ncbi:MAG: OmpA family protein [Paludibacteraceae bacterium]|nr:OmpA family protein [Paludibacteraceae bacterium]
MKHFASIILALTLSFPTFAEGGFRWCLYFFDFNSPIKPEYEAQLEELAEFIKSYPDELFEISGHTDARASYMYSIRLDFKRAQYIRQYLIENYCIPDTMLVAVGRRNHEPYIKDAKTEAEHEWNRRIEIRIIRKDE